MSEDVEIVETVETVNSDERSISELVLLDHRELTEEEFNRVVEWRAAQKARDTAYTENNELAETYHEILRAAMASRAEIASRTFKEKCAKIYDRLDEINELREQIEAMINKESE